MKRSILIRALALTAAASVACADDPPLDPGDSHLYREGELTARPETPSGPLFGAGEHVVDLGLERNPILYVPESYDPLRPAPLLVLFHGSEGSGYAWRVAYEHADRLGIVLLMIQSGNGIWDFFLESGFDADAAAVDAGLEVMFDRVAVHPAAVAFGGFSAGATYSVQLGLRNPELVRHVIAWSGEFYPVPPREPIARLFITHGTLDDELPIFGARRLVETLELRGYDVTYTEFEGGHTVPAELLRAGFDWLASTPDT